MAHQLIIVRHAKSAWDDPALDDYHRPLSPRGLNDMPQMAHWLAKQKLHIDQILSSPAKRAKQTAHLLCKGAGINDEKIKWRDTLYLADLKTLLETIGQTSSKTKQLMLIGHNPGLEELVQHLCGNDLPLSKSGKLLTTAAIAIVSLPNGWHEIKPHTSHLIQLIRPKELPKK